jgi:diadenosine tetraphosphate (Ap4A) HIT family hydrolase
MIYDIDNVFAKILRNEIKCEKLYEDEYTLAFEDINPQAPVHILVIPKNAYICFADFAANASPSEVSGFFKAVSIVAKNAKLEESGYRLIANNGKNADQVVLHFHVHILGGKNLGPKLVK